MNWHVYKTPKQAILDKLKEIGMAQLEDRKGPEKEMNAVANKTDSYDGTETEYFKTVYDKDELKELERNGSHPDGGKRPTKEQPAVEEIKS